MAARKTIRRRLAAAFEPLESRVVLSGAPLITEFMAINDRTLTDEDGDFSDWIEVYNPDADELSLDGWFLTDDPQTLNKWQLPAVILPTDGYLVLFASGKNRAAPESQLHTNFKLSGGGEFLALIEPNATAISQQFAPGYPPQLADVSYGLSDDLTTPVFFESPTPGATNIKGAVGLVADPIFSVKRGFYETPIEVEITTATTDAEIRYSLDGSVPTATTGDVYMGAIQISSTSTVRAAAFKSGNLDSAVDTHTYLFLENVLTQTKPESYPDLPAGDYNVLPSVVDFHRDTILDDLQAIPTVSLVLDVDDMFGPDGTNITGVDNPTSMEIIFPDGSEGFQIDAGVRQQGGASRLPTVPKHAFRLKFTSEFGPTKLEFPLFEGSPVSTFDTVILRAGLQDGWQRGASAQNQYVKDEFARRTQLAMGHPSSHGTWVHLYLNGLYWGMYNLVERPDASFASEHLGGDKDDWDAFNAGRVRDGNDAAWNEMLALTPISGFDARTFDEAKVAANYEAIQEFLDIPAFIDYVLIGTYMGTQDWLPNNYYAARRSRDGVGPVDPTDPARQFKFFHWDQEESLKGLDSFKNLPGFLSPVGRIYQLLRLSPEFREFQGQRLYEHLFNGGALSPEMAAERYQGLIDEVKEAIKGEAIRWGSGASAVPDWQAETDNLMNTYFPNRREGILDQYRRFRFYPNIDAPVFSQQGGSIRPVENLTMAAPEGDIYYTLDGSDPKLPDGSISPNAMRYTDPITLVQDTLVRARALSSDEWSTRNDAQFEVVAAQPMAGDFDGDGDYDCEDIDVVVRQILGNVNDDLHDLNDDGVVDTNDIKSWMAIAGAANLPSGRSFLGGDTNLDGLVNPTDLEVVGRNWLSQSPGWCAGDFNADGVVNAVDLNEVGRNWRMDVSGPPQAALISRARRAPRNARFVTPATVDGDISSNVRLGDDTSPKARTTPEDGNRTNALGRSANVAVRHPLQERRYRRLADPRIHQQDEAEIADEVFALWHALDDRLRDRSI